MATTTTIPVYQDPRNELLVKGLDLLMSVDPMSANALFALIAGEEAKERPSGRPTKGFRTGSKGGGPRGSVRSF
jgi:hypothetical protein